EKSVARSLVVVGHVREIEVVAIGVVVAAAGERSTVDDRERRAALPDAGAGHTPASGQSARAWEVISVAEREAIGHVPPGGRIELVGVDRRRIDARVILRRGARV